MSSPITLIIGMLALLLGLAMVAGWFDWLLRVGGVILIVGGVIGIVVGAVGLFSNKNSSGGYGRM